MRPAAVVDEFVPAEAEARRLLANLRRRTRVGGEEVEEAAEVVFVSLGDFGALAGVGGGVVVGTADEIGGDGPAIIEVVFAVLERIVFQEAAESELFASGLARFDPAGEQLVI